MKLRLFLLLAFAWPIILLAGCDSGEPDASQAKSAPKRLANLTETQTAQKEKAHQAKEKLFKGLVSELMASMAENGPAKSIRVCKQNAPEIAANVAEELNLRIGRTSFKLRNPENEPPSWAVSFVQQKVEEEVFVSLPESGLGVLSPIRLKPTCIVCHGDDSAVTPEVKAAIVSSYPEDDARGFAEGDLRGYFWIEVPGAGP